MAIRIAIENGAEGRTILWALDHPGCFAYGENTLAAFQALPTAVLEYNQWLEQHGLDKQLLDFEHPVQIEETWEVYHIDEQFAIAGDGYEVNAWFQDDWKPLTVPEIQLGIDLLGACRTDLLSSVTGLNPETLNFKQIGERWSIAGILNHVANADWWYLDRLGLAFPREELPSEPSERLEKVRRQLLSVLPDLAASNLVVGIDGEFWSPRKLLRRAVWHERDHTAHIHKLLAALK